jgi:alpha-L-fucosidase
MRTTLLLLVAFLSVFQFSCNRFAETKEQHDARMDWWRDARFGMFIHWGLYAIPAGEWQGETNYGEWIRHTAKIPLGEYDKFQGQFNPVDFNADEWVSMAKAAGMKYIVITTKHHDGFCMFDTKQTDYNIMNTLFRRDVMQELADACRKHDIRLCFYYSIMDWHHPDYMPRRDWEEADRPVGRAGYDKYVKYMKNQLKELLTRYGDIGVLWFDGEWEGTWNSAYGQEIYDYVRSLQPAIIVNNRVGSGMKEIDGTIDERTSGGDFGTPEQQIPPDGIPGLDWETCMTMNTHWGYNKADKDFKSTGELIWMLADISSKGGNFLLNVGPTAGGTFPPESVERLEQIGEWMRINGESIYGTEASPFKKAPDWGRVTMKRTDGGLILFLHVSQPPADKKLIINGCLNEPEEAVFLAHPDERLDITRDEDALIISMPDTLPDSINSVIRLTLKGKLDLTNPPDIDSQFDLFVDTLKVWITTERENVELHFTTDGADPEIASDIYTDTLALTGSATVKARCSRDGKPVSGIASGSFTKILPVKAYIPDSSGRPTLEDMNLVNGIDYQYFEGEWDSLPGFSSMEPVKEGDLFYFTFEPRDNEERFGFLYSGFLLIPETNVYTFYTASDDGSRLFINNTLVVDNDGLHGTIERKGTIALEKGYHLFRVEFFEKTGGDELKVKVMSPSLEKQMLPKTWLYRDQTN